MNSLKKDCGQAKCRWYSVLNTATLLCLLQHPLRACFNGRGGPQVVEATCGGSPNLSCKRDQIKMRDYMGRRVTPSKRVTSPTLGPPPHCKQAFSSVGSSFPMLRGWWITSYWYSLTLMVLRSEKDTKHKWLCLVPLLRDELTWITLQRAIFFSWILGTIHGRFLEVQDGYKLSVNSGKNLHL